jgi:hypothetical protein
MRLFDVESSSEVMTHALGQGDRVSAIVGEGRPEWVVAMDLPEVINVLLGDLPGVLHVRLLERPMRKKAFVVVSNHDLDRDFKIATRFCQIRDIMPGEILDYDVVPADREVLIPVDARTLG